MGDELARQRRELPWVLKVATRRVPAPGCPPDVRRLSLRPSTKKPSTAPTFPGTIEVWRLG